MIDPSCAIGARSAPPPPERDGREAPPSPDRPDGGDPEPGTAPGGVQEADVHGAPRLTDLHSHLVPGVDDGARDLEGVLEGVGRMVARGVTRIVTTPHLAATDTLKPARLASVLAAVDEAFESARSAVEAAFPGLDFLRGHEVMLDVPDPDLGDPRLWLGESAVVLVEWPGLQFPPGTPRVVEEMVAGGVRPMIAHPERYRVHNHGITTAGEWRDAGAWLQVNHGSLVGRYGPQARLHAFQLLARGWVDCLATDFHGRPHLRLYIRETEALFRKSGFEDAWNVLTSVNPERIQRGEPPIQVTPLEFQKGVIERIRNLFGGPR